MADALDASGPSPKYKFKKSGDYTGDEAYFKNYRKLKTKNGSTVHTWFDPEILGKSYSPGGTGWEYRYKAKIRFEDTKPVDLVNLAKFIRECKSKGVLSLNHKIQLVEFANDFYPYLPQKCSPSEKDQIFKDLMQYLNSRFLISDPKEAFFSERKKHTAKLVVSRRMLEQATFYQNWGKKRKKGQQPYKQGKLYWKFRPFVRAELTFFRPKLGYEKINTIRDLFAYNITGLVSPMGRKSPELRFLIPRRDRFKRTFWKHLEGSRIYKGVTNGLLGVGNIFLAELVVRMASKGHRPPNFYRDFFDVDERLTRLVLDSLKRTKAEFNRHVRAIDALP
jgi:hypothetical protein